VSEPHPDTTSRLDTQRLGIPVTMAIFATQLKTRDPPGFRIGLPLVWATTESPMQQVLATTPYKRRNISKGGIQNQKGTKFVSYSSSTLALLFHLESPLGLGLSSLPSSLFLHLDCSASSKPPPLRSCTLICIGIKLFCELIRKGVLTVM